MPSSGYHYVYIDCGQLYLLMVGKDLMNAYPFMLS